MVRGLPDVAKFSEVIGGVLAHAASAVTAMVLPFPELAQGVQISA